MVRLRAVLVPAAQARVVLLVVRVRVVQTPVVGVVQTPVVRGVPAREVQVQEQVVLERAVRVQEQVVGAPPGGASLGRKWLETGSYLYLEMA